ncbi:MAG: hypothetical protein WBQ25_21490 [Nitrososphaeraceae archaeon]
MSALKANIASKKQRALILAAGELGAYEAGVIKAMCNNLLEQNKKNEDHDGLLFDIFACKLGAGKMRLILYWNGLAIVSIGYSSHRSKYVVKEVFC